MFKEDINRFKNPLMGHYHSVYEKSTKWDGRASLNGKHVIIYCEQGFGDIIQFARYFSLIRGRGCKLTLHCPYELHRLFANVADGFVDKWDDQIPAHDYHIPSLSLPFLLEMRDTSGCPGSYLSDITETADLGEHDGSFKIGIAWEGNPNHSNNAERSCPLEFFVELAEQPNVKLFMLQNKVYNKELLRNAQTMPLYGWPIADFYDTAVVINSLDCVVSVDTSVLHLAGAMGKKVCGLLSYRHDPRWKVGGWYPTVKMYRQKKPADWDSVFDAVFSDLGFPSRRRVVLPPVVKSVLITGGIGDVITLEGFMPPEMRATVETIYYATRQHKTARAILEACGGFPNLVNHRVIWEGEEGVFAMHSKAEVGQTLDYLPGDWANVADWSILAKFPEIRDKLYEFKGSGLLSHEVADVSGLNLPSEYDLIAPYTAHTPETENRNFDAEDWEETLNYLRRTNRIGVVVNAEPLLVPEDERLVNLTNKTTLLQSVEVLKKANGYVGARPALDAPLPA